MSSRSGGQSQKIELTEAERELLLGEGFGSSKLNLTGSGATEKNGDDQLQTPTALSFIGKRSRR